MQVSTGMVIISIIWAYGQISLKKCVNVHSIQINFNFEDKQEYRLTQPSDVFVCRSWVRDEHFPLRRECEHYLSFRKFNDTLRSDENLLAKRLKSSPILKILKVKSLDIKLMILSKNLFIASIFIASIFSFKLFYFFCF